MTLSVQDLATLYTLAQHGIAALFQRTEAALIATQAAAQVPAAPVDSTPPAA